MADLTIQYEGDTWRVLSTGAERDGKVYAHLASITRTRKQRNGENPVQMCDWVPVDLILGTTPAERAAAVFIDERRE